MLLLALFVPPPPPPRLPLLLLLLSLETSPRSRSYPLNLCIFCDLLLLLDFIIHCFFFFFWIGHCRWFFYVSFIAHYCRRRSSSSLFVLGLELGAFRLMGLQVSCSLLCCFAVSVTIHDSQRKNLSNQTRVSSFRIFISSFFIREKKVIHHSSSSIPSTKYQ